MLKKIIAMIGNGTLIIVLFCLYLKEIDSSFEYGVLQMLITCVFLMFYNAILVELLDIDLTKGDGKN